MPFVLANWGPSPHSNCAPWKPGRERKKKKKRATVTSNKSLQMCRLTKDREKKEDGATTLKVKVSTSTTEGLKAICAQNVPLKGRTGYRWAKGLILIKTTIYNKLLCPFTFMTSDLCPLHVCSSPCWRVSVSVKTCLLYSKNRTKQGIKTRFIIKMFITLNKSVSLSQSLQVKDSVQNMAAWFCFKKTDSQDGIECFFFPDRIIKYQNEKHH